MPPRRMIPWKTSSRRPLLDCGRYLKVEMHTVHLPDGRTIEDWPWVITPDFINVVAETIDGDYLCFRQTKYAVEGTSFAPVGGYIEPGEEPLAAAQRELLEEAGYRAAEWIALGTYPVDANRGAGTGHFYLARGACRVSEPASDDLEEQVLLHVSRSEMAAALAAGEFKVLPWAAAVAFALAYGRNA